MALRECIDANGVQWKVWRVTPTTRYAPPTHHGERRKKQTAGIEADRRRRLSLTPGMENGWLCFESRAEKRRLVPVPPGWDTCTDGELLASLERARPVRRRVIEEVGPEPLPDLPIA